MQGSRSFRAQAATAQLPDAGNQTVVNAQIPPRPFYGTLEVNNLAKELATGGVYSFADLITYHADETLAEMTGYMEGMLFRDNTGSLGTISALASTVATVTDSNIAMLYEGTTIDTFAGTVKGGDSISISLRDWENSQLTLSSATSVSVGDNIYLEDSQTDGEIAAREFDGLRAATAETGTYLSLDRSTYPRWRGNLIDAANSPLDEDLVLRAENRVLQEGGEVVNPANLKIVTHRNQFRKFAEVAYPRQDFSGTNIAAGVTALSIGGHAFVTSPFAPETDVFIGDCSKFNKYTTPNGDLQLDDSGGVVWQKVPQYDAIRAYFRFYGNYAVRNPRHWVRIQNVKDVNSR